MTLGGKEMKYGIFLDGLLLEKFDTPEEAYDSAKFAYEETGLFHEVRTVHPLAKTIND
jgi:hypothetical protein